MEDRELRELQNAEIRRREGLEDATCTDPTCDWFKCNKRYHLTANVGRLLEVSVAHDEEDAGKTDSPESPPLGNEAMGGPPADKQERPITDALEKMLGDEQVTSQLCAYAEKLPGPVWFPVFVTRRNDGARFRIVLLAEPAERVRYFFPAPQGSRRGNPEDSI